MECEKVVRQSASAYYTWDITWTLCNACDPAFYWPVRCSPCSCQVCSMHGVHSTEKVPFSIDCRIFSKGVVFIFWHHIAHIELLYCVTNFELVWTWNKVAVFEDAKKSRLYPTLPYHDSHWLLVATKVLTDKLHSLHVKEPESKILEKSESDILPPTLHPANKLLQQNFVSALCCTLIVWNAQ